MGDVKYGVMRDGSVMEVGTRGEDGNDMGAMARAQVDDC